VPPQLPFGYAQSGAHMRISPQQQMIHNRKLPSTKRSPLVYPSTVKPIEPCAQDTYRTSIEAKNRKFNHVLINKYDHESNNGSDNDSSGDETQVELSNIAYKMRNDTLFAECKLICPDNIHPEKASVQRHIYGPDTGKSKGFAYITFSSHGDAKEAVRFLHHTTIEGRIVEAKLRKNDKKKAPSTTMLPTSAQKTNVKEYHFAGALPRVEKIEKQQKENDTKILVKETEEDTDVDSVDDINVDHELVDREDHIVMTDMSIKATLPSIQKNSKNALLKEAAILGLNLQQVHKLLDCNPEITEMFEVLEQLSVKESTVQPQIETKIDVDENACKVCFENPIDCVLLKCGHMVVCIECGTNLKNCPICRQAISEIVKTFKA